MPPPLLEQRLVGGGAALALVVGRGLRAQGFQGPAQRRGLAAQPLGLVARELLLLLQHLRLVAQEADDADQVALVCSP